MTSRLGLSWIDFKQKKKKNQQAADCTDLFSPILGSLWGLDLGSEEDKMFSLL